MLPEIYNKILENSDFCNKYNVNMITINEENIAIHIKRKLPPEQLIYTPNLTIDSYPSRHNFIIQINNTCFYKELYIRIIDKIYDNECYLSNYYYTTNVISRFNIIDIIEYIKKVEYDLLYYPMELGEIVCYNEIKKKKKLKHMINSLIFLFNCEIRKKILPEINKYI